MTYQLSITTEIGIGRSIAEIAFWKPWYGRRARVRRDRWIGSRISWEHRWHFDHRRAPLERASITAGIRHLVIDGVPEVEVAFAFQRVLWRKGLASEITEALVNLGFTKLHLPSMAGVAEVQTSPLAVYWRNAASPVSDE